MPEREPQSATNIVNQYEADTLVAADESAVIPWSEAAEMLAAARSFWWATTTPDGRPHVRPVLAVFLDGVLYSTTRPTARKAKNLAANPTFAAVASADAIDFTIEGTAAPVNDASTLERLADAYHAKYEWPVTVQNGAFHAPFGAPTAAVSAVRPNARRHLRIWHE